MAVRRYQEEFSGVGLQRINGLPEARVLIKQRDPRCVPGDGYLANNIKGGENEEISDSVTIAGANRSLQYGLPSPQMNFTQKTVLDFEIL